MNSAKISRVSLPMRHPILIPVVSATVVLLLTAAFWHGLTVTRYEVLTPKLKKDQTLRIVTIADLHSCRYGKGQKKLLDEVRYLMPDVIFLTGDCLDDLRQAMPFDELAAGLRELGVPVYAVIGNHELRKWSAEETAGYYGKAGIVMLDNETVTLEIAGCLFSVSGLRDADEYYTKEWCREIGLSLAKENSGGLKILLAHRPEHWQIYRSAGFDITFSGHAHGGQVRIPGILPGLYAPGQGWFPKRAGGLYQDGGFVHIVSRGLSRFWRLPRVFNPPELVLTVVRGAEDA